MVTEGDRDKLQEQQEAANNPVQTEGTLLEKMYLRAPFLVLQVVTNTGLYSVPGRTK